MKTANVSVTKQQQTVSKISFSASSSVRLSVTACFDMNLPVYDEDKERNDG